MGNEEKKRDYNPFWIIGMLLFGGGIVAFSIWLFTVLCGDSDSGICGVMKTNPPWYIITGLAIAPATVLFWIWRDKYRRSDIESARANIENEKANIETARANNLIADRGQVTERFSRAIEHLGSGEIEVRLGGIYALEKIAQDYHDQYMSTIIETLSAFVRVNSKKKDSEEDLEKEPSTLVGKDSKNLGTEKGTDEKETKPDVDIQAALTVLGRMENKTDTRVDLNGAHLEGAQLEKANLEGAKLGKSNLERAVLNKAKLNGANLMFANLEGSSLREANLRALLIEANLKRAFLLEAKLERAVLIGANLEGAILLEANLEGAILIGANLEGAILIGANLEGAEYNSKTIFPEGFDPEKAGMVFVGDKVELASVESPSATVEQSNTEQPPQTEEPSDESVP